MRRNLRNATLVIGSVLFIAGVRELIVLFKVPAPLDFALGFGLACGVMGLTSSLWREAE